MGYVLVDNTAAGRGKREYGTRACCHCQAALKRLPNGNMEGIFCSPCSAWRCANLKCSVCVPFMKKVDRIVDREARALALVQQRR